MKKRVNNEKQIRRYSLKPLPYEWLFFCIMKSVRKKDGTKHEAKENTVI